MSCKHPRFVCNFLRPQQVMSCDRSATSSLAHLDVIRSSYYLIAGTAIRCGSMRALNLEWILLPIWQRSFLGGSLASISIPELSPLLFFWRRSSNRNLSTRDGAE